jgi:membrane protease YdiL (CAAX protease family)
MSLLLRHHHPRRTFTIRDFRHVPYRKATHHPWPCLLFLLPLLAAYEIGVVWVGGTQAEALRNGVDAWLRWALESFGLNQLYWSPALLIGVFVVWTVTRLEDRPDDLVGVCLGMAIESVVFGLGLWALSRGLGPMLDAMNVEVRCAVCPADGVAQVVTFVGAGIYEEMLFRLVLYSGLVGALRFLRTPTLLGIPLAAAVSATVFAAAHHIGPYGEPFDDYAFLFRTLAGLYFAGLYQFRGFGIAVGAHACYDVLVG